jgi:hypothetical protein
MTGQELRRELLQVDFGVKPTDREVSDTLAQGIIRYLARKYSITPQGISSLHVLEEAEEEAPESSPPVPSPPARSERDRSGGPPSPAIRPPVQGPRTHQGLERRAHGREAGRESSPVLRKLTLDDVPRPAPSRHPPVPVP